MYTCILKCVFDVMIAYAYNFNVYINKRIIIELMFCCIYQN